MSDQFRFILGLSILFPAIIATFRLGPRYKIHRPFLLTIFLGVVNELLTGFSLMKNDMEFGMKDFELWQFQLWQLAEWFTILLQFSFWGTFNRNRQLFHIILLISLAGWVIQNLDFSRLYHFKPFFLISYSLIIIMLSIYIINRIFSQYHQTLVKNGVFILCVGMIVYFINSLIMFLVPLFFQSSAREWQLSNEWELIKYIYDYTNVFSNIIYGIGIYYIREDRLFNRRK